MKTISHLMQNKTAFALSIVVSVFLVVSLVSAATTISTNISTAGNIETTAGTLTVGTGGTAMTKVLKGTCTLTNYSVAGTGIDANHAASTTVVYQCPVTGVVSGDTTIVQLATSTPMNNLGWVVVGSTASSTSGYINVLISNLTGQNKIPSSVGVGSSTSYIVIR